MQEPRKFNTIWIELFGGTNIWWIQCGREHYAKLFKRNFDVKAPMKEKYVLASFDIGINNDGPVGCIWLSRKAKIRHVVHECFHAAHWFYQSKGGWLTDASEEMYAYLIEFLVDKIIDVRLKVK